MAKLLLAAQISSVGARADGVQPVPQAICQPDANREQK
jgi:hypothetical protein